MWVDKNLKHHSLIQAFSRTNRILNSVKTFGNIVCFRDLEKETEEAIALFGNEDAGGIVLLKSYSDYYYGYDDNGFHNDGYVDLVDKLLKEFPLGQDIIGEKEQKRFIALFGQFLRLKNILSSFDQFEGMEILPQRDIQNYQSVYIDLYDILRPKEDNDKEDINDDLVFEVELIKQVEVNIDYILMLVAKYKDTLCQDKEILATIKNSIGSSLQLRSKKELIENFIDTINVSSNVSEDWKTFVIEQEKEDFKTLVEEENLNEEETRKFISNSFNDGQVKTNGTEINNILPPMGRFGKNSKREEKKKSVIDKIIKFFEKYFGLGIFEL